jgi:hypothetical protein
MRAESAGRPAVSNLEVKATNKKLMARGRPAMDNHPFPVIRPDRPGPSINERFPSEELPYASHGAF